MRKIILGILFCLLTILFPVSIQAEELTTKETTYEFLDGKISKTTTIPRAYQTRQALRRVNIAYSINDLKDLSLDKAKINETTYAVKYSDTLYFAEKKTSEESTTHHLESSNS